MPSNFRLLKGAMLSTSAICLLATPAFAQLDEIVVTATKRVESEQDVSISMETVAGESLVQSGVKDFEDLAETIPNFFISDGVVSSSIAMRGFSSGTERGFEQSVSMFIDGIFMPRSRQYRSPFFDAERVEVIRGPQAVLFGQNSTAGAISVVSAKTRPGDEAFVEIGAGYEMEYGGYRLTGVAGGSLGDTLGARIAIQHSDSGDGYIENGFDDSENGATEETLIRGTLVWEPSDNMSITAKFDHAEFDLNGSTAELFTGGISTPALGDGENTLNYQTNYDASLTENFGLADGLFQTLDNLAIVADVGLGEHTLTLTGGYSDYSYEFGTELDFSPVPVLDADLRESYEQFSGEIRLSSPIDQQFEYVVGAYVATGELFNDTRNYLSVQALAPLPQFAGVFEQGGNDVTIETDTISIFGIGTFNISQDLRIIGGVRYNNEKKSMVRDGFCDLTTFDGTFIGPGFAVCPSVFGATGNRSSDNFLPEATLEYDFGENSLFYAKIARSAKSGGFALSTSAASADQLEFDDEKATNYEAGIKTNFWDNRALFNLTVFNTEFRGLQLNSFTANGMGSTDSLVTNAGKARSRGVEGEFNLAANEWVTLSASAAVLDAKFTDYLEAPCNTVEPDANGDGICDHTGLSLPYAPDVTASMAIDIDKPISSSLAFIGGGSMSYSSALFTDGTLDPGGRQGAYEKFNARVGIRDINDRWDVSLVGRNLSNEQILNVTQPGIFGGYFGYTSRPRTVTVQGRLRF